MTVAVFKCSHGSGGFGETRGIRAVIQMRPAAGRCEANIRESIEVYYGDSTGGWETTTKCDRETHLQSATASVPSPHGITRRMC